jgi:hypothetical protein
LAVSSAFVPGRTWKYAFLKGFSPFTRADVIDARRCPESPEAGTVRGAGGATQAVTAASRRRGEGRRIGGSAGSRY